MNIEPPHIPLCVDLDGTLLKTDTLWESCFALLRRRWDYVFLFPVWLARGRLFFKNAIASRVDVNIKGLPYHQGLLSLLRGEHEKGRKLVLITASNEKFAHAVAAHLGIFEKDIYCSDDDTNMRGGEKLKVLLRKYGSRGYDYAANSHSDLAVWAHANRAIVVSSSRRLIHRAQKVTTVQHVFRDRSNLLMLALKEWRLHHWVKNILVFAPLIASHQLADLSLLYASILAFLAFGFCASSVYVLNDCLDLEADRRHPEKRERPLASGELPITLGMALIPLGLLASMACSAFLPVSFWAVLALYFVLTVGYSLFLKQIVLVDVILLALLYISRIYGGGAAVNITPSHWLLTFSLFLFLSLALMKRFSELQSLKQAGQQEMSRRGYLISDLEHLASVGSASGYISVLVLALYINSRDVLVLYSRPELLWLLCPLLMYWISRAWLLAYRQRMDQDPVIFAARDGQTQIIAVIMGIILILAR